MLLPYNLIAFVPHGNSVWAYYHTLFISKETEAPGGGRSDGSFEPRLRDSQDCALCTHEGFEERGHR